MWVNFFLLIFSEFLEQNHIGLEHNSQNFHSIANDFVQTLDGLTDRFSLDLFVIWKVALFWNVPKTTPGLILLRTWHQDRAGKFKSAQNRLQLNGSPVNHALKHMLKLNFSLDFFKMFNCSRNLRFLDFRHLVFNFYWSM